ncbi:hypothetical protein D3C78_1585270 [compost metagenome]
MHDVAETERLPITGMYQCQFADVLLGGLDTQLVELRSRIEIVRDVPTAGDLLANIERPFIRQLSGVIFKHEHRRNRHSGALQAAIDLVFEAQRRRNHTQGRQIAAQD